MGREAGPGEEAEGEEEDAGEEDDEEDDEEAATEENIPLWEDSPKLRCRFMRTILSN